MISKDEIGLRIIMSSIHELAHKYDMGIEALLVTPTGTEHVSSVPAWVESGVDAKVHYTKALSDFEAVMVSRVEEAMGFTTEAMTRAHFAPNTIYKELPFIEENRPAYRYAKNKQPWVKKGGIE